MVLIRQATPADASAILQLRRECFGAIDEEKADADFWRWEFAEAPFGAAKIFIADDSGRLLSHFALIPQQYAAGADSLPGALAVDAMTAPAARKEGLYSRVVESALQDVAGEIDVALAFQIRRDVLGAMLRNGWREAGTAPVLVRPASLRGLAFPGTAADVVDFSSDMRGVRLTSEESVQMEDVGTAMFASAANRLHLNRTARWIRWRYFDNPRWRYEVRGIRNEAGALTAWVVTRRTTLRGFDTVAVVDLAFRPGQRSSLRRLLRYAAAAARRARARLLAALITTCHPAFSSLLLTGFLPGPHRFRLLTRTFSHEVARREVNARWCITWGETDHL